MTPLVLLPGMMCDARLFAPQISAVSGHRAVHHAPISGHESTAELAAAVLAHAPPRFALAGLSMGGIVAMEIAHLAPDRIAGLALLDTNPCAEAQEVRTLRGRQMAKVRAGHLADVMRDELKPRYVTESPRRAAILALCMDMALDLGPDVFCRQSIALRDRPDRQETLAALDMPTLILCGRHDRLCPVSRHEWMNDLMPGSRLEIVEGAGHLPTLEAPDVTTRAMMRWLEDT
ncbi:Pimeloyl-[acyl-carrier protein] methyl ester esterase [Roseivivax jejudonensis]|uniref:Pimeloyl-[acyl-carrier protein] methyl ester esterase n=1 Tax=Roseivivax jejudonensis TaxID=1529041 RepID=A0A1X6YF64_9RHOB|nr:alpha/beta fold hydrolase [Roseivivax jejudonensis]SLN19392.1 Pimeloyl-[acyl-carrier protein] methyl ester esterase [Roseivivax jejudonensis]